MTMKMLRTGKIFTLSALSALITFSLYSCKSTEDTVTSKPVNATYLLSQQNVDAVLWTATSAEMHYAAIQAFDLAALKLRAKLQQANDEKPKAVVLDLDETVLDNSPYMFAEIAKGETFDSDSWYEWCMEGSAGAVPGALEFIRTCKEQGVDVYFISNRGIETMEGTLANLKTLGLPTDKSHVLLKEGYSDKTDRRNTVLETHEILLYIGDNLRDFSDIYKFRNTNFGKSVVDEELDHLRENFVIIPNPMYGEWRKPVYMDQNPKSDSAKAAMTDAFIKSRSE